MNLKFPLFALLLLLVAALPLTAAANGAVIDVPLDFTLDSTDPSYPGESGDGWSWDAGTKVLTLSGINIDVDAGGGALVLPDGAEIVLDDGTENNVANSYRAGILCCEGSLALSGGGDLNISAGTHGIRAYEDLTIDMTGEICIEVLGRGDNDGHGLRVGNTSDERGDLVVRNCSVLSINFLGSIAYGIHQGIRCDGDVTISDCDEVSILVPSFNGIRNFGDVTISGCSQVSIAGFYNGIRSSGDVVIADCPDIEIKSVYEQYDPYELNELDENGVMERPDLNGIYTTSGSVTIARSALTVYGRAFGIATGPTCYGGGAAGGDIVIDQSTVHASCSAGGYAAIFAGDDVYNSGEGEHARIVLNGCEITVPTAGRILDVSIVVDGDSGIACQSITALPGIEEITEWPQAAKTVVIEPETAFSLTYNANGGSGSMTDPNSPYSAGVTVTVLPNTFTAPSGFVFTGWNTAAEGSGTAYNPGVTFAISGNTTLYAQWARSFTVNFNSQGGSAVGSITVAGNSVIVPPEPPGRDGYTFGGWYKEAACINAWNFDTDEITGDITLYAKWIPSGDLPKTSGQGAIPTTQILLGGLLLLIITGLRKVYA